jgi:hypothetical protein
MVGNNYFSCVSSICTYRNLFIEIVIHGHYNIHVLSSFTYPNLSLYGHGIIAVIYDL